MSFMDQLTSGFDKAKEGVSDFAETTKIKHEISVLNDRKTAEQIVKINSEKSASA